MCVVLEEAGDVVPADVEGFDARWRARDAPTAAPAGTAGRSPAVASRLGQLPVVTLDAANEPAQMIDDEVSSALRGHVLGNIPDEAVLESHVEGNPDTSETITRIVAKTRAIDRALTADLILYSRTLRGMRSSEHQHNKLLAAHVLSSSCPNSGVFVQSVPPWRTPTCKTNGSATSCAWRFGIPCVTPLAD